MTTALKGSAKYAKADVLSQLHEAKSRIEAGIESHDEAMKKWRETAPQRFADAVARYPDDKGNLHFDARSFEPPRLNAACNDWRVQALNRSIARVVVMDGDVITLRGDDPLWEYVGLAACI